MSLPLRLILAVLPIPALFAAVSFFWLMGVQADSMLTQERTRAQTLPITLANNCAFAQQTLNPGLMQTCLNALFVEGDIESLEVVDNAGRILAHHDPSLKGSIALPPSESPGVL